MSKPQRRAGEAEKRLAALEVEIEMAWCDLTRLPPACRRTLWLSPEWLVGSRRAGSVEVGTYTRAVTLAELREDVFWTLEGR